MNPIEFYNHHFTNHLSLEVAMERTTFVSRFKELIDPDDGNSFLDEFIRSDKIYLGTIDNQGFRVRRKRQFLKSSYHGIAQGKLVELDGKTRIDLKIFGFEPINAVMALIQIGVIFGLIMLLLISKIYAPLFVLVPFLFIVLRLHFNTTKASMKSFSKQLIKILRIVGGEPKSDVLNIANTHL